MNFEQLNSVGNLWATRLAQAYQANAKLDGQAQDRLARWLYDPFFDVCALSIPPQYWGRDYVNPTLAQWEAAERRAAGPRLAAVDPVSGSMTLS